MSTGFIPTLLFSAILAAIPCTISADDTFTLVIDAGHGGKDPGAVNGKNQEKSINLKVALRIGALIEQNCPGTKVIYTRNNDVFVELYKRADIANKADADLFVSIHTNSAKSASAQGAETYLLGAEENRTSANLSAAIEENRAILLESDYETHYEGYNPNSAESQIIFEFMQNEYQKESLDVATLVQNRLVGYAKRHDHGVHQAGYLVLWKSAMPSILIELGYISNATDLKYMISSQGIEELSQSIYLALKEYIGQWHANRNSVTKPAVQPEMAAESENGSILFEIQILTSESKLGRNSPRLKGLDDVRYYMDGSLYKYTTGSCDNYGTAQKKLKEVRKIFKDAFIIATENGHRIDLQKAIQESESNGNKNPF